MGTFASLQKLYDNIEKTNAVLAPAEACVETERYVSNVITGISTIDVFYDLFDNAFAGSTNVHRFSRSERARRKAVSASVRRAMTSYISTYADEKRTLPEAEPWLRQFVQTHILDGLDERLQSGFLEQAPTGGNLDYLASGMVRDIVLLEHGNPPPRRAAGGAGGNDDKFPCEVDCRYQGISVLPV